MTKIKRDYNNKRAFIVSTIEIPMTENGAVEWMINFEGGGWNSVWAKTEKQALTKAKKEYKNNTHCVVSSVSIMTPSKEEAACRNFY